MKHLWSFTRRERSMVRQWSYGVKAMGVLLLSNVFSRFWDETDVIFFSFLFSLIHFTCSIENQGVFHKFQGFHIFTGWFVAHVLFSILMRHTKFKHTAEIFSNGYLPLVWYACNQFSVNTGVTVPWCVVITQGGRSLLRS